MSQSKPIECVGIILDGNRRWAKEKGLPTLEGHRRGFENLKSVARAVRDRDIPHLVVFAFSTENWNRTEVEISSLMDIFRDAIRYGGDEFAQEGIRLRFIGQRERFSQDIQDGMNEVEKNAAHDTRLTLWICLSYGARAEIVAAAHAAQALGKEITEEKFGEYLWTKGMPDPDIVIRTGGAQRLSNFLLWQSAYSELFFLDVLWPAFTEQDLDDVLSEYTSRQRNFGV